MRVSIHTIFVITRRVENIGEMKNTKKKLQRFGQELQHFHFTFQTGENIPSIQFSFACVKVRMRATLKLYFIEIFTKFINKINFFLHETQFFRMRQMSLDK